MIYVLIVFVSMLFQDIFAAAKISFLNRKRPWLAGIMEAGNDVGASFSIVFAGVSVIKYGLSLRTLEVELALVSAAIIGTKLGDWLSRRLG